MLKTALGIDLGINGCRAAFAADSDNTVETLTEDMNDYIEKIISGQTKSGRSLFSKKTEALSPESIKKSIISSMGRDAVFKTGDHCFSSQEVLAIPLMNICRRLEDKFGKKVGAVCFSVPLYFNSTQRRCLTEAARISGIRYVRVISQAGAQMLYFLNGRSLVKNAVVINIDREKCSVSYIVIEDSLIQTVSSDIIFFSEKKNKQTAAGKLKKKFAENNKNTEEQLKDKESSVPETALNLAQNVIRDAGRDEEYELFIFRNGQIKEETVSYLEKGLGHTNIVKKMYGCEAACGAEEQASMFCRIYHGVDVSDRHMNLIMDNFHSSVRIRLNSGETVSLIERNTVFPYRCTKVFKTSQIFQSDADILFTEGENKNSRENDLLCGLEITGIRPRLIAGREKVKVDFNVDENGVFSANAFSLSDGKKLRLRFSGVKILSEEDIRMSCKKLTDIMKLPEIR